MEFIGYTSMTNELNGKEINGFFLFQTANFTSLFDAIKNNPSLKEGITTEAGFAWEHSDKELPAPYVTLADLSLTRYGEVKFSFISQSLSKLCSRKFSVDFFKEAGTQNQKFPLPTANQSVFFLIEGNEEIKVGYMDVATATTPAVQVMSIADLDPDVRKQLIKSYPEHKGILTPKKAVDTSNSLFSF